MSKSNPCKVSVAGSPINRSLTRDDSGKMPEIQMALVLVEDQICDLETLMSSLYEKLDPVLKPDCEAPCCTQQPEQEVYTSYGLRLTSHRNRLRSLRTAMNNILDRLAV